MGTVWPLPHIGKGGRRGLGGEQSLESISPIYVRLIKVKGRVPILGAKT